MKLFSGRYAPFWGALASTLIYWAALPPLHWKYAIVLPPAIWAWLATRRVDERSVDAPKRRGWRRLGHALAAPFVGGEYRQYWTASFCFWLATVVWVSYPHPATTLGWIALSAYLACYLPLFIASTRAQTRLLRLPVWLAAPISWVAVEYVRNRALGGFSFAGLSHALYDSPEWIQIAEPLGEYGVGATIVLVGTLIFGALSRRVDELREDGVSGSRRSVRYWSFAALIVLLTFLYGRSRLEYFDGLEANAHSGARPTLRVALLQDSTPYHFPPPTELNARVSEKYIALANEASRDSEGFDFYVWPEGCYFGFFFDHESSLDPLLAAFSTGASVDPLKEKYPRYFDQEEEDRLKSKTDLLWTRSESLKQRRRLALLTSRLGAPALIGTASAVFDELGDPKSYNSAVFAPYFGDEEETRTLTPEELLMREDTAPIDYELSVFRRYDKVNLVLFGEYIPFLEYMPDSWGLKGVCSESVLGRGSCAKAFVVTPRGSQARFIVAPHICFESSIPQYIKKQVRELRASGMDPDVLASVSHDGWFRCGMQTDLHLATQVFRAIENRRAVLCATHGGFSAHIAPTGRIVARGSRGGTEIVPTELVVVKGTRQGLWGKYDLGEIWSCVCAWFALVVWAVACVVHIGKKCQRHGRCKDTLSTLENEITENEEDRHE